MTISPSSQNNSQTFLRPKPVTRPRLRLFCFPYAGGSASVYHAWPGLLAADIELLAVQYPGRATRLRDAPCRRLGALLDDIEASISAWSDAPFAFFGHSMGATVAFELTRRLQQAGKSQPRYLFLSGRSAPQLPPVKKAIHALPDSEFLQALRGMNGTPAELLEHQELMEMLLPILRADFEALETWEYRAREPLDVPVSVFGGLADDSVPLENLDAWSAITTGKFKRHVFPGDHFFLNHQHAAMLSLISRALAE